MTQPLLPLRAKPRVVVANFGKKKEPEVGPPLFDPDTLECRFISGAKVWAEAEAIIFVGWILDEEVEERRVVLRFAVCGSVARELHKAFGEVLR